MTAEISRLPLSEPVAGVRLLPLLADDPATAARVRWLLDLGQAQRRRAEEARVLQATAAALQQSLQSLPAAVAARLEQVAAMTVELGIAVAREIVGAALQQGLVDPTPTVLHCLRDAVHGAERADLRIHVHPDDMGPLLERLANVPDVAAAVAAAQFVADAALTRGAVRAETGAGRLRWEPQQVFERVAAAVRDAAAGAAAT
jgi:flagellar biosynthesis/type III secretory pathway protein FliH